MTHHAYVVAGEKEQTATLIETFLETSMGIADARTNPDVHWRTFGLLSVEDARSLISRAYQSAAGEQGSVIVVRAGRFFHEAQNALLKVFEEPPTDTTIILSVPSLGMLLPTLRSRLHPLPGSASQSQATMLTFFAMKQKERVAYIAQLMQQSKSDNDETKQTARVACISLAEELLREAHEARGRSTSPQERETLTALLADLTAFMPLLHERSAPLKPIFEHLLLVIPTPLGRGSV